MLISIKFTIASGLVLRVAANAFSVLGVEEWDVVISQWSRNKMTLCPICTETNILQYHIKPPCLRDGIYSIS